MNFWFQSIDVKQLQKIWIVDFLSSFKFQSKNCKKNFCSQPRNQIEYKILLNHAMAMVVVAAVVFAAGVVVSVHEKTVLFAGK